MTVERCGNDSRKAREDHREVRGDDSKEAHSDAPSAYSAGD